MPVDALTTVKTIVEIAEALVMGAAVIVGGYWAYYKFIKGRTFRPHVEVEATGRWLGPDGSLGLHLGVRLKNIGSGKVELLQLGTGVKVSRIADSQAEPPAETHWTALGVFEIFTEHEWIEPGETICDELLVRLPLDPQVLEVQTRLVLQWKPRNVTVDARRILVPESFPQAIGGLVEDFAVEQQRQLLQQEERQYVTQQWEYQKQQQQQRGE